MDLLGNSIAAECDDSAPREKCGVVAVFGAEHAAATIYNALFALQHRGQEGAGMVVSDGKVLRLCKGMGLVSEVFTGDFAERLLGQTGIGHVRYSTTGSSRMVNVQPFLAECRDGMWAIAHNGNLVNAGELRDRYQKQGSIFQTTTDSEILLHQLSDPAFFGRRDRIRNALAELCGSFAFVIARPGCVYAARDPWGIRPLSLGRLGRGYVVASETCAMQQIGAEFIRDINPGELVKLDDKGVKSMRFADVPLSGYGQCVFEHIYFARPDSHVFGQSVYQVRSAIGKCLAREHPVAADVVVPIPDSGVLAALGYAHESGLPFEMGFIRNHYVGRTFIMPSQSSRSSGVDLKLAVVPEVVAGKRVVLVDDSIIRGTTISKRIAALRQAGAREVHVRISCPPTRHPCFFGIDFPDPSSLVAHGRSEAQIRRLCGADSVGYLSLDGLRSALRNPEHYCMGCFTGRYVCQTGHAVCKNGLEHNGNSDFYPRRQGLYDPAFEKDACGVGMVCSLKGERSHDIVVKALRVLSNLEHRGATGYDPETGDGAGITLQLPHEFFRTLVPNLPAPGAYGVGMVFLPQEPESRRWCESILDQCFADEGLETITWRDVPVRPEAVGELGRSMMPFIRQVFVGCGRVPPEHLDRHLFIARKLAENEVRKNGGVGARHFYLPSCSSSVIVYKGLMRSFRVAQFYPDLENELCSSALALVHQRYSTNTFPAWPLAQPFRFISHNGEINTLRGNMNWMTARQGLFRSELLGTGLERIFPILTEGASDSAILDNAIELLYHAGRSLPHAVMMLIPEAWHHHGEMSADKKAFYEYHACLTEPWDGPASIPFTDGKVIGAVLDRNGLRPSRYTVTRDGLVVMASETGVLEIDPADIVRKGRLQPGRMFLVDTRQGRIVDDAEIKDQLSRRQPYAQWLSERLLDLDALPAAACDMRLELHGDDLASRLRLFGYSMEDLKVTLAPMGRTGAEPVGSMGNDAPLAVLSKRARLFFDYFHQLFAQVTNPPLDAIREELVTALVSYIGKQENLLDETPLHCAMLRVRQPLISEDDLAKIITADNEVIQCEVLPTLFEASGDGAALASALEALCCAAEKAVDAGKTFLVLSDRAADAARAPMPSLLAVSAVHHHLVRRQLRAHTALAVDAGDPREVHHFATLLGFGADVICPYMAFAALRDLCERKLYLDSDPDEACRLFIKAVGKGLLKVMSKMGISTLQSYRGAQIFEILGLNADVVARYFTGTVSRVQGIGLKEISAEALCGHAACFTPPLAGSNDLPPGGVYQWRRDGEAHLYNPATIALLQQALRQDDAAVFRQYVERVCGEQADICTLRGLMRFKKTVRPVPLEEVEPWTEIVKRFKTGAMSYGSISRQAHETLAIAMNRIGGSSNSGEGGEAPERYRPGPEGNLRISMIKQVASGRFGVTSHYLVNARELQIKMAQGAKPGEGGQLPAEKVFPWIAATRFSTPYVQLISPPPHHDIYSIEDLAQLIHDLKNANPEARISVKLVSEAGVGTIAAGVAKGKADLILISGWDGGTGASPMTAVKHAGLPWELGLAEAHQTLLRNRLRDRVRLECDGKLMCGRDVAVACLLGAEEFGFATAPLVALGCVMMRVCHLNTCPQGIATQDPRLSAKFAGKSEYVVNFMRFMAEDFRRVMAGLGFRTVDEMVGRSDLLEMGDAGELWKARGLDYSAILRHVPSEPEERRCTRAQDHGIAYILDRELIRLAEPALEGGEPVTLSVEVRNVQRTIGTMLSSVISRKYGAEGLPEDTIRINCRGTCGQSFGAFGARGLTLRVEGDANDYFGKGLSGAKLIIYPPSAAAYKAEENIIVGNVALYGATQGEVYIRGLAGERFCVRNSGAAAVVEGVGDHGCEYMTGGRVLVLGPTGRNFAAGMSGGVAYVLDERGLFAERRCNRELVDLEPLSEQCDMDEVQAMLRRHLAHTGSAVAQRVLNEWYQLRAKFIKVMPRDYKRALARLKEEAG